MNKFVLLAITLIIIIGACVWLITRNSTSEPVQTHDVVYGRKAGMTLTLEVMQPLQPNGIGVILINSNGFRSDESWRENGFQQPNYYQAFLDRGQTVFIVSHREGPLFPVQDIVEDIYRAVRYVRYHAAKYKVDPDRLAIVGSSSGGYLSLLVATGVGLETDMLTTNPDAIDSVSAAVQAVASFFGPADLMNYAKEGQSLLDRSPAFAKASWGLADQPKEKQLEILKAFSPYEFITAGMPPTILIQGTRDAYVPRYQSERMWEKLKANNVASDLIMKEGGNHGWSNMQPEYEKVAAWFELHLQKKH